LSTQHVWGKVLVWTMHGAWPDAGSFLWPCVACAGWTRRRPSITPKKWLRRPAPATGLIIRGCGLLASSNNWACSKNLAQPRLIRASNKRIFRWFRNDVRRTGPTMSACGFNASNRRSGRFKSCKGLLRKASA